MDLLLETIEKADLENALKAETWFETRFAFGFWVVARVSCIKVG